MALARITGAVLSTNTLKGTTKARGDDPGGRAYSMTFARVLVENLDITEVQIPDDLPVQMPRQGEYVDWLVELSTYSGRLSVRLQAEYAAPETAGKAA
jgi:hypothetical protein